MSIIVENLWNDRVYENALYLSLKFSVSIKLYGKISSKFLKPKYMNVLQLQKLQTMKKSEQTKLLNLKMILIY